MSIRPSQLPRLILIDTTVSNWNSAQPGYSRLSPGAKELFYWTNYSRQNPSRFWDSVVNPILQVVPALRGFEASSLRHDLVGREKLPLFKLNSKLIGTAQAHADDQVMLFPSLSHISSNGKSFSDRMTLAGIEPCFAQNISVGSRTILFSLVLLYLDRDLPHQGHRDSLLNSSLTEIGIGYSEGQQNQFIMIQDMACNQ